VNCHLGLTNVEKAMPQYETYGLHRSTDPGAGAFTPYYSYETFTAHDIPKGGELFRWYGDRWLEQRTEILGYIPLTKDYATAEEIVTLFKSFVMDTVETIP